MNNATPDFNSQHFEVAGFIREVFGYMERFKGQLFVLKIEDDLMSHPLFPVLMRDIAILQDKYIIDQLQPYNFFPRTPHIENLAILRKV